MASVKTYNSRLVTVALGTHSVTGFADDSFVTVEPLGDGVTSKSGCDGEVARAVDPNEQYSVKITLLQTSSSNAFLQAQYNADKTNGDGAFPILIKDLKGNFVFSADAAWVVKPPSRAYGKETNNREWELQTGQANVNEGTY